MYGGFSGKLVELTYAFDSERTNPARFKPDPSDPARPDPASHAPMTPKAAEVGALISEGNRLYADFIRDCKTAKKKRGGGSKDHRLFLTSKEVGADPDHQTPYAAVLGCIDSRVPVELVTGQAANDMFGIRTAGNILLPTCAGEAGGEARASLEYVLLNYAVGAPTGHKTLSAVVVLGHTKCGAISAAYDIVTSPKPKKLTPSLDALVEALRPTIERVVAHTPGVPAELRKDVISVFNSLFSARTIAEMARQYGVDKDLGIYFGTYKVAEFEIDYTNLPNAKKRSSLKMLEDTTAGKMEAWKTASAAEWSDELFSAAIKDALDFVKETEGE